MIELTVYNYLKANLGVPVYMEIPSNPPSEYVTIEKTGSSRTNYINEATFAIQSHSTSLYKAASLNESVKTSMFAIIESEDISRCELNGDYNYPDTTNKNYRYQAVFDLVY